MRCGDLRAGPSGGGRLVTTRYRKKPVIVEAEGPITRPQTIETLEGTMRADVGDYIITGVQGERYPCKADIFKATYERVSD